MKNLRYVGVDKYCSLCSAQDDEGYLNVELIQGNLLQQRC